MIVTLTPNPSVDRSILIDALRRGEVHRATDGRIDAGGKGVNVSRALTAQRVDTLAVIPVGGPEGHVLDQLLDGAQVAHRAVPVSGAVRMNISVLEPDGTTTKLNEPGPELTPTEVEAVRDATLAVSTDATWVVGCGSLPPGMPETFFADLVTALRGTGPRLAIDSSGAPLACAVSAAPHLIKPNHEELAELVGHRLITLADVRDAALDLVGQGIELVAVSLGAHGALLVCDDAVLHSRAHITHPLSTVGAGDCMLAGLLHGLSSGADTADALMTGVIWGAAAVTLPGSRVPAPGDLDGIPVDLTDAPDLALVVGE